MKILVTGGSGYKGSVLIPMLLKDGHHITNIDTMWFGNNLDDHKNLHNINSSIKDITYEHLEGIDVIIHLANIANDPAVEINPVLSWEVNVLSGQQLIDKASRVGVKQFIYASSGSVYGIKDELSVTEELELVPISVYNKTKMVAERVFLSYVPSMQVHCIRPATVCGVSPRMRLDVSVNLLTYQALTKGEITVFGGNQTRPNIHILDIANVYRHFLKNRNIDSGCYNAGFENISILEIAELVAKKVNAKITVTESNDPRSYRQDSSKLLSTGFKQNYQIKDAIDQIVNAYKSKQLPEGENCYTVKKMKKLGL